MYTEQQLKDAYEEGVEDGLNFGEDSVWIFTDTIELINKTNKQRREIKEELDRKASAKHVIDGYGDFKL